MIDRNKSVIEEDGIWSDVRSAATGENVPALFLDRDGTLIELVDYLADPDAVQLFSAVANLVSQANRANVPVVIVTNQSGIGRGYYDWGVFNAVQRRIDELLANTEAWIDAVYACPHPPPNAGGPLQSAYRKPAPGMILRAGEDLSLDLAKSWIMGDAFSDLAAGRAAGLRFGVLAETGYGARDRVAVQKLVDNDFSLVHGVECFPGF
jgi:D-glycero-D-manno-heptose 1,7-bisphosphate phosphatase